MIKLIGLIAILTCCYFVILGIVPLVKWVFYSIILPALGISALVIGSFIGIGLLFGGYKAIANYVYSFKKNVKFFKQV